jgi:REP element-mobilizing transposase RayT
MGKSDKRNSLRLSEYDYSQAGAYFITLLSHRRECVFGRVIGEEVSLSEIGEIVQEEWFKSRVVRAEIRLFEDELIIMPNHMHGIVWIVDSRDVHAIVSNGSRTTVGATGQDTEVALTKRIVPSIRTTTEITWIF